MMDKYSNLQNIVEYMLNANVTILSFSWHIRETLSNFAAALGKHKNTYEYKPLCATPHIFSLTPNNVGTTESIPSFVRVVSGHNQPGLRLLLKHHWLIMDLLVILILMKWNLPQEQIQNMKCSCTLDAPKCQSYHFDSFFSWMQSYCSLLCAKVLVHILHHRFRNLFDDFPYLTLRNLNNPLLIGNLRHFH